jgi:hypothetical protein
VDVDIAEGAPCHIVTAQEVDPAFVNKMMTVRERSGQLKWHVLALDHGDHKTCIIAARRSFAKDVRMLERHVTNDGEYKVKGGKNSNKRKATARSRMLVGEVVCQEPVDGRKTLIVATVHLHHQTAKKASGFAKAYDEWWRGFEHVIRRKALCGHLDRRLQHELVGCLREDVRVRDSSARGMLLVARRCRRPHLGGGLRRRL